MGGAKGCPFFIMGSRPHELLRTDEVNDFGICNFIKNNKEL